MKRIARIGHRPSARTAFPGDRLGSSLADPRSGRTPGARLSRFLSVLALALLPGAFCLFAAAPAQAQTGETVWSATLRVGEIVAGFPAGGLGCSSLASGDSAQGVAAAYCTPTAALTDNSFSYGGYTFTVNRLTVQGSQLVLGFTRSTPASIQNSLKLVVGNRDQEFTLSSGRVGSGNAAGDSSVSWRGVSVQGWRVTGRIPVSLVRANLPGLLSVSEGDGKVTLGWQEPPGVSGTRAVNLHVTTSTTVGDYAASTNSESEALGLLNLSGVDLAAGWVNVAHSTARTRFPVTGLVNGRKYRFRVRYGFAGANGITAWGAWSHGSGTPSATPPVTVRTPDANLLTALEIKGVRANGTETDALPLSGSLANAVGLGGPGLYAIRVPPAVKKLKIKVTFTNTDTGGFTATAYDVTRAGGDILNQGGWGLAESGETRELLLRPGSGVTRIYIVPGFLTPEGRTYNIYAYHDNFADSANANLRTLQMNAGN